jgi:aminoglycoside phosphotransferase (APT) family kinase protein
MSKLGYQSDSYQTFLKNLHKKFRTPEKIIAGEVFKATQQKLIKLERIIQGEVNEVYDVILQNGKHVIVRIARGDELWQFEKEKWAIDQCQSLNIPLPKILWVNTITAGNEKLAFNIEEKLAGKLLSTKADLPSEKRRLLVNHAGLILSRIHKVKTNYYGSINENGKEEFTKLADYLKDLYSKENDFLEAAIKIKLDQSLIKVIFDFLLRRLDLGEYEYNVLLHHDFSPRHILVIEGNITGILDFGNVKSGYPIDDIAWWDYFEEEGFPTEWLIEGYSNKKLVNDSRFNDKLHYARLMMSLEFIYWFALVDHKHGAEHTKKEVKKDLKYFKLI